jgi:hypothetical protein
VAPVHVHRHQVALLWLPGLQDGALDVIGRIGNAHLGQQPAQGYPHRDRTRLRATWPDENERDTEEYEPAHHD